uniref:RED-like N-terminal domain-containing protein n=1 Tax=Panagrolaimus sp. JU765 TaxID=591449 RepID=A0AC34QVC3_9BILA
MNNDDFRRLLTTLPKSRPSAPASSRRSKPLVKPNFQRKKKDDGDKTEIDKLYDESQQHLTEIMKSYRDRAAERRKVDNDKEVDESTLRLMIHGIMPSDLESNRTLTIEQSKLLGGDLEHTHMVKGLDYTLLDRMRTDTISSDEETEEEKEVPASQIPPEKCSQNPMIRRMLRILFHTQFPKRNEHFAPGRMAYVCDFEDESTDVPSTLIRSLDVTPKENPQVKNDKLILEHLTNILPYLRDKKRKKKKKEDVIDSNTKIFEDAGEYDTRVKPLEGDRRKKEDLRDDKEKASYFEEKRDRKDKYDSKDRTRRKDDRHRDRSSERHRERSRSPDTRKPRDKPASALSELIAIESRKRASSPSASKPVTAKKKFGQEEAYGEYYTEDMDFVETIASDDDDDEALAIAKARTFQELGTDGKADKSG